MREGGLAGLRDEGLLRSAIARPWIVADQFPSIFEKAAALAEAIVQNHPFLDTNKRVAALAAARVLDLHGYAMTANPAEFVEKFVALARHTITGTDLARWLLANSTRYVLPN